MPSNTPVRFSGPLGWAIAGIAAGALFAAGALTARAFIDDSSGASQPPTQADTATDLPAIAPNRPGIPMFGQGGATAEDKTTATTKPSYWGPSGCPVPLPSGTLGQSVIDLQGAGLTPRLPKDGFQLTSVNLSAFSDCAPDGTPTGPARPVLSTSWRHTATGLDIQLTQSPTTQPVAPVLRPDGATFAEGSQAFTVSIYAFAVEPLDPRLPSPRGPHPRAGEVLREFIAQIVPGFDQQCFWTLADGDWNDLATYGVGDPRPAIPSEFTLQETHVAAFRPPAGPCDTTVKPTDGFGLYATWSADDGSSIGISVNGMPTTVGVTPAPGYIDRYSASWVNGQIQYNVWLYPGPKTPATTPVRDIARALDPAFNDACFVQIRTLSETDLRALGFRAPQPPAGYTIA
uniref:hypothetical protein n=1 Tax=Tepidiforma sp. TaxID=2682230 RepID=UPI002ADE49B3